MAERRSFCWPHDFLITEERYVGMAKGRGTATAPIYEWLAVCKKCGKEKRRRYVRWPVRYDP